MADTPRFEMRHISRSFPGVKALDDVGFACLAGEVHALCGENGAGKSTLMKILGGVYQPDAGEIRVDGRPVALRRPIEARRAGISIIHQELSLLPERSVAENIALGLEPSRFGVLRRGAMRRRAAELLERLGASVAPDARAGDLSIHEQQIVEIAKALAVEARILVMDEPTAALDDVEAARLLALVRRLRAAGVAVVYISHRMPEVFAIADRITVLKDGRLVGTHPRAALTPDDVVRMMVGRPLSDFYSPHRASPATAPLLAIAGGGNAELDGIDLELRPGEIVAVAGLEGSGKDALGRAIFGVRPFLRGGMRVGGVPALPRTPREAVRAGIGYLPDDRKADGLALGQSVLENALLARRGLRGLLARPAAAQPPGGMAALLDRVDVRAASYAQEIRFLSGGNQQKTVLARWLAAAPALLVCAEPTRGVDVAAKAAIYRLLREAADAGKGVLVITSDLPEAIGVADRLAVMRNGRIAGMLPAGAGEEAAMALATGHGLAHAA